MEKINKLIEKISKDKKVGPLVIAVLVLIFICFCLSYFNDVTNISKNKDKSTAQLKEGISSSDSPIIDEEYEAKQIKALEDILATIDGVGEVKAELTFSGSEVKVPAKDKNTQENKTEEEDSSGGKRVNSELTDGDKIVMENGGSGNTPVILETKKPQIVGAIIVAEGAQDQKIKYEITKAVASLYNISLEDVNVFSMKKNSK